MPITDRDAKEALKGIAKNLEGLDRVEPSIKELREQYKITGKAYSEAINSGNVELQKKLKDIRSEQVNQTKKLLEGGKLEEQMQKVADQLIKDGMNPQAVADAFGVALDRKLGVDFRSEFFLGLKKIREGSKEVTTALKGIGKALALDKVAKKVGGFWDFLKKAFMTGLVAVGFIKFLEGWQKAEEWFGANANFGERISSALAGVVGAFMGLDEEQTRKLAQDINIKVQGFLTFVKEQFEGLKTAFKTMWESNAFGNIFDGIKLILNGEILAGLGKMKDGFGSILSGLMEADTLITDLILGYIGIKAFQAGTGIFKAVRALSSGLLSIGSGISNIAGGIGSVGKAGAGAAKTGAGAAGALGKGALTALTAAFSSPLGIGLIVAIVGAMAAYGFYKLFGLSKEQDEDTGGLGKASLNEGAVPNYRDANGNLIDAVSGNVIPEPKKVSQMDQRVDAIIRYKDTLEKAMQGNETAQTIARQSQIGLRNMSAGATAENLIFDKASNYEDYKRLIQESTDLSDAQKQLELKQMSEMMQRAKTSGATFADVKNIQYNQNQSFINRVKPEVDRVLSFSGAASTS